MMAQRRRQGSRDAQVLAVTRELDARMDDLKATVDALNAILTRPQDPPGEAAERLVNPA